MNDYSSRKVILIKQDIKVINNQEFNILENLTRLMAEYKVYRSISMKQECIIREVHLDTNINRTKIYKIVDKLEEDQLIEKDYTKGLQINGSRFTIVARPELKVVIRSFEKRIFGFTKNMTIL